MEPMVNLTETPSTQQTRKPVREKICAHSRLIDDVRTAQGKRTGKVRCLECQAVINDPYQGTK